MGYSLAVILFFAGEGGGGNQESKFKFVFLMGERERQPFLYLRAFFFVVECSDDGRQKVLMVIR